jgi:hypothetical protein
VNYTTSFVIVTIAFSLFFLYIVLTNEPVYSQQPVPNAHKMSSPVTQTPSSTPPKQHEVKITSPIAGKQVPVGKDLAVSGISNNGGNKTSHCQVSVIANGIKPYQPATGTGPGGAADYSTWNFVLSSKYTTIKQGPSNKITAKYACSDNPNTASFYSVNVTGVAAAAINNATITKQQQQQPKLTNTTTKEIYTTRQQTSVTMRGNTTAIKNNITTDSTASQPLGYDKLIYLDNGKLHDGSDKNKPIPRDTPFILPFP